MIFQVSPGVTLLGGPRQASHGSFSGAFSSADLGDPTWTRQNAPMSAWECCTKDCATVPRTNQAPGVQNVPCRNIDLLKLQRALTSLSQLTGRAGVDPHGADGLMGPNTRNAVVQSLAVITPHIPTAPAQLATVALAAAALTNPSRADQIIVQYAGDLAVAANIAGLAFGGGAVDAAGDPVPAAPAAPPWYKTWWGVGGIAIGGLGALVLVGSLLSPPPRRALPAGG